MKQKNDGLKTFLICAALIAVAVVVNIIPDKKQPIPVPQPSIGNTNRIALEKTLGKYLGSLRQTNEWWLVEPPPPESETVQRFAVALANVSNALHAARSTSPITEEIAQNFSQFYMSAFDQGASRITMEGNVDMESLRGKTEVCFFSKKDYTLRAFPSLLYYRKDWKAIMLGGVRWSGPLWNGILYHELYHGLKHQKGESDLATEKYVKEEAEAHELEIAVIDYMTRGAYRKEAESILGTHAGTSDERKLLGAITPSDLLRLDTLIGLENEGPYTRGVSTAQHILTLGFAFIDRRGGTIEDKASLYRWIRKG